jgi:hypothetical protein
MSIAFIAGILVLVVIVIIAVVQRSRPRVTTIETRREAKPEEQGE